MTNITDHIAFFFTRNRGIFSGGLRNGRTDLKLGNDLLEFFGGEKWIQLDLWF